MWSLRLIGAAILAAVVIVVAVPGGVAADEGMPVRFYDDGLKPKF